MKLVRDKIPQLIKENGKTADVSHVRGDLYSHMLARKLNEELEEFMQNPCPEEAGDILEVCRALFSHHGFTMATVSEAANKKKVDRGSFSEGIVLHGVL